MSLLDVVTLLQETNAKISETELFLASHPQDIYAQVGLASLQKRLDTLQQRFDEIAVYDQVEVLRYRMLSQPLETPMRAVNDLLGSFQQSFTVVLDAINTRSAKKRARVTDSSMAASDFAFAYTYPGSLGFALTLPKQLSLIQSDYDATIKVIQHLIVSRNDDDIKSFAQTYGVGAVRTLYKWFEAVAKHNVDSEVKWLGSSAAESKVFLLQGADARVLRDIIARTSDTEYSEKQYRGTLLAYDSQRKTFRFSVANKVIVSGTVAQSVISQLVVPEVYDVELKVATITKYSSEQKEERFELVRIEPNAHRADR